MIRFCLCNLKKVWRSNNMSCYNKKTFKVYGNKVKLRKKEDTYVVDIYLKKEVIESFVSDEDAESKGESWARKTFFYLCYK